MARCLLCLVGLSASGAVAGCPQGQEAFTSCQIKDRSTEVFVCFDNQIATYSYGPIGGSADLILSESIERIDFEPWSGLGSAISESVTFYNQDFAYNVGGGFERPFSEEEMQLGQRRFGWVEVTQRGESVAYLECVPETVTYGFGGGLYDVKTAMSQIWDWDSKTWVSGGNKSDSSSILNKTHKYGAEFDCLHPSEFDLNGVGMGDPLDELGKLGSPEASDDDSFSDEPIDRMSLVGANIDFFQDKVVSMAAISANWKTPSGLRVGLTRGDVIRLFGRVPGGYTARSGEFIIPACSENHDANGGEWYAIIEFGQNKRVDKLILVTSTE